MNSPKHDGGTNAAAAGFIAAKHGTATAGSAPGTVRLGEAGVEYLAIKNPAPDVTPSAVPLGMCGSFTVYR